MAIEPQPPNPPSPFPCGGTGQPACPPTPAIEFADGTRYWSEEQVRQHAQDSYEKGVADTKNQA